MRFLTRLHARKITMSDVTSPVSPQRPVHWGLPGTLLWGLLIALVFVLVSSIVTVVLVQSMNPGVAKDELEKLYRTASSNGNILSTTTIVTTLVSCSLIALIIKLKKGARIEEYLCLRMIDRRDFLRWLMYAVVFFFSADLLNLLLGRPIVPEFMRDTYATAHPFWLLLVAFIVAAPLFEETFFRGFLFAGLQPSFVGSAGTVVLTAAAWGLLHLQYDAFDITTIICFGLLLGWARLRSRSLLVPMGMHALTNLVAIIEAAIL
jgi:uncharacterized protein